jgi:FeS assembly SUF system protein
METRFSISFNLIQGRSIYNFNKQFNALEKIKKMNDELQKLQDKIVVLLRTVYDPEIPVNIYDLGLIYDVDIDDANNVTIEMTFTSPSCPAADFILMDVQMKIESIPEVNSVDLNLTFDPPWDKSMMSEEALLELGFM